MLGSPVYASLAGWLAEHPAPARAILGDEASWDGGLRLFAGLHYLALTGVAPDALDADPGKLAAVLAEHEVELRRFATEQRVQTNEVARCGGLLPCFLEVARRTGRPLELVELGASAGLNLLFDRFRYVYRNGSWGSPDARVVLRPREVEPVPADLLDAPLEVRRRRGIDLAPIDATTDEGHLLLQAFLWPGRDERVDLLDAAVATLREQERPSIVQGDYVSVLPPMLAERPGDAVTVVFQTASTAYLSAEASRTLSAALETAGADGRPLAWVSTRRMDQRETERVDSWEVELRIWPEPVRLVAHLDFHGNWLEWLG